MTTFAVLVYLVGATLGQLVRLPVLVIMIFGLVLAAIASALASVLGLGTDLPSILQLLLAVVLIQMGYGTTIFLRAWIARCRQRRAGRDASRRENGRMTQSSRLFDKAPKRVLQD